MDSTVATAWWMDRTFWVALFAMVLPPLSRKWGVPMDPMQMSTLAVVVASYIAAHHWGKAQVAKAIIEAAQAPCPTCNPAAPPGPLAP